MPLIPHRIPNRIPASQVRSGGSGGGVSGDQFSLYDVALNGIGFTYANTPTNPLIRETAQYTKQQIDQAETPGEQTLSNWWLKSQDSFHGGAGQINLEPPFETPVSHVRFDLCKNIDPFTPGVVRRLPDTVQVSSANVTQVVSLPVSGADALAILLSTGAVHLLTNLDGTVSDTTLSGVTAVKSLATDGARIYCADAAAIHSVDPAAPTLATTIATYPATATSGPVIGWAKSRLMLGVNGAVYQVDVSQTGVTLGATQLLLQHPTPGWTWRCFTDAPTAVLAAGDAGAFSEVAQFELNQVAGAPVLQDTGTACTMPVGERVLSMANTMGTFEVMGTTRGVRVCQYNTYSGKLELGPLSLSATDPVIPANAVLARDRFVYAVGLDYDEAGLIAIDLGTQTDQAGRFAWAPNLVTTTAGLATAATSGTTLALSARIAFAVPGHGVYVEGTAPGSVREAWLRTSRIRFGTTEPKLFKLGTVRADLSSATIEVSSTTPTSTTGLATLGFTSTPPDFRLPTDLTEWLQLTFTMTGSAGLMRSYAVKALPGTRRQIRIKQVLAIYDSESTRSGQQIRDQLSARDRLNALEALAAAGDEVLLQEYTPSGVIKTIVVVESVSFAQIGRPTRTSDVGGEATVILRTVES